MLVKQGIKGDWVTHAAAVLALLWFYAAISKLFDFQPYIRAMQKQPFGQPFRILLIYGLPPFELITGAALLSRPFLKKGLYVSAILLLSFTIYIGLILSRFFGHIPCGCGGVISHMGWTFHLWFNLCFLALNLITIVIYQRKEFGDI